MNTELLTVESLSEGGPDRILARVRLSRRRDVLLVQRASGYVGLAVAALRDDGSIEKVLGCSHFKPERLADLELAVVHARKTLTAAS
jgi:hypothetical protein